VTVPIISEKSKPAPSIRGAAMPGPHRRHRFLLNLETDTLEELVGALRHLADEIEVETRDSRRFSHRGTSATYRATLRTDPEQDAFRYREQLAEWTRNQRICQVYPRPPEISPGAV
jgi:hypothetical protein